MVRRARHIWMGDGGDTALVARMRAQANFIEYTPITLILVGAIELARPGSPWLLGTAAIYLLGRIAHGWAWTGRALPAHDRRAHDHGRSDRPGDLGHLDCRRCLIDA
jgi:uncharacterized membrane protein YecN with MAPEG domain